MEDPRLRKPLLEMTEDELREKIREIREDRKIRKEPAKARKAKVRQSSSAKDRAVKIAAGLSDAEKVELMKLMGDVS
jgi:hypothetical protein